MSRLAIASGDRVGLLAYGRETQQLIAPARGGAHLRQIMESLALVRGEAAEADHLRATVTLNRLQPRRSLVLWLTDPAETSMQPEVAEGAAQLMRRHLVLFVAIEQRDLRQMAAMRPENQQQIVRRRSRAGDGALAGAFACQIAPTRSVDAGDLSGRDDFFRAQSLSGN